MMCLRVCSDIAVGAPFDGDGKVFIYRGSDAGIETKPAQVSQKKHNLITLPFATKKRKKRIEKGIDPENK